MQTSALNRRKFLRLSASTAAAAVVAPRLPAPTVTPPGAASVMRVAPLGTIQGEVVDWDAFEHVDRLIPRLYPGETFERVPPRVPPVPLAVIQSPGGSPGEPVSESPAGSPREPLAVIQRLCQRYRRAVQGFKRWWLRALPEAVVRALPERVVTLARHGIVPVAGKSHGVIRAQKKTKRFCYAVARSRPSGNA